MQCKYCQKDLDEGVTVCPYCGESQEESKISKQLKVMKILVASVAGLMLLVLLAGVVNYGVTGSFLPRKNDLYYKNSYTVSEEKLDTDSGNKSYQKKLDKVVATMGEHTLTNRMLQIYYWQTVNNSNYADLDKTEALDAQYQDPEAGKTWEQFFIEEAITSWKQDMVLLDAAKAAGFEMPKGYADQFTTLETDMAAMCVQYGYSDVAAYLDDRVGRGVNFQTYYDYMWNYYLGALYWTEHAQTVEVTDDQIEAYFQEHEQELKNGYQMPITKDSGKLVDVRHILVKIAGGTKDEEGKTVYSEEDWETCRVKAQAILDEWLAGDKTEDSFAELAAKKTEDSGSKQTGGLYEYVYKGQMVQEFEDWCFDETREEGHTGLVKTTYGYHVMYYVYGEEGWLRVCRDGAKVTKAADELEAMVEKGQPEINYKNIVLGEMK